MIHKSRLTQYVLLFALMVVPVALAQYFELPPLQQPWKYGNILITRQAQKSSKRPVSFSHWSHRTKYTCRVCHFELGFAMQVNATEITEKGNQNGEYCGACHNGEIAFGHTEKTCGKCHNNGWKDYKKAFKKLASFPQLPYGNKIDWVKTLDEGLIQPKQSIYEDDFKPVEFTEKLQIDAGWTMIPPALFSHEVHQKWLDCGDCHPALFNVKKTTTQNFEMRYNLEGKFCGACHMKVAFPMDDCKRCHPGMKS